MKLLTLNVQCHGAVAPSHLGVLGLENMMFLYQVKVVGESGGEWSTLPSGEWVVSGTLLLLADNEEEAKSMALGAVPQVVNTWEGSRTNVRLVPRWLIKKIEKKEKGIISTEIYEPKRK